MSLSKQESKYQRKFIHNDLSHVISGSPFVQVKEKREIKEAEEGGGI